MHKLLSSQPNWCQQSSYKATSSLMLSRALCVPPQTPIINFSSGGSSSNSNNIMSSIGMQVKHSTPPTPPNYQTFRSTGSRCGSSGALLSVGGSSFSSPSSSATPQSLASNSCTNNAPLRAPFYSPSVVTVSPSCGSSPSSTLSSSNSLASNHSTSTGSAPSAVFTDSRETYICCAYNPRCFVIQKLSSSSASSNSAPTTSGSSITTAAPSATFCSVGTCLSSLSREIAGKKNRTEFNKGFKAEPLPKATTATMEASNGPYVIANANNAVPIAGAQFANHAGLVAGGAMMISANQQPEVSFMNDNYIFITNQQHMADNNNSMNNSPARLLSIDTNEAFKNGKLRFMHKWVYKGS